MGKRINRYEFNEILRNMPNISPKERGYLNRVFSEALLNGLDLWELKNKINQLYYNKGDELDEYELKSVKEKLLKKMGN